MRLALAKRSDGALTNGMGWGGMGMGGHQKCPSIFFILRGYIDHVYIYICNKILSRTFLWVSKFDLKWESLDLIFKTLRGKCVFEKSC